MKKELKSFICSSLLAISLSGTALAYTDVSPNDWSYQAIAELTSKYGALAGYPDGSFKPKKNITREEVAAELYQVMRWMETHQNSVAIEDLRKMNMMLNEYRGELAQLQNEVRAVRADQQALSQRVEDIDAQLDWNTKNRGLVHMLAMSTGKVVVGAGKDVISVGKGAVWLFTLGRVNLFDNPNRPPDPIDKTNRYNGPIQFLNGSSL